MANLQLIDFLDKRSCISRKGIKTYLMQNKITMDDSTITRQLKKLINDGIITRKETGYYFVNQQQKSVYRYNPSKKLTCIIDLIQSSYPNIDFVAWEYVQFNEFINHLIGRNAFIIEAEKYYEPVLFELLNNNYPKVLLDPSYDLFSLYSLDEPIIVKRKISRSPINTVSIHQPPLEKLLIDLLHDQFTSKLINNSEKKLMFENCFNTYYINSKTMNSYAERRNAKSKLEQFLNSLDEGD